MSEMTPKLESIARYLDERAVEESEIASVCGLWSRAAARVVRDVGRKLAERDVLEANRAGDEAARQAAEEDAIQTMQERDEARKENQELCAVLADPMVQHDAYQELKAEYDELLARANSAESIIASWLVECPDCFGRGWNVVYTHQHDPPEQDFCDDCRGTGYVICDEALAELQQKVDDYAKNLDHFRHDNDELRETLRYLFYERLASGLKVEDVVSDYCAERVMARLGGRDGR